MHAVLYLLTEMWCTPWALCAAPCPCICAPQWGFPLHPVCAPPCSCIHAPLCGEPCRVTSVVEQLVIMLNPVLKKVIEMDSQFRARWFDHSGTLVRNDPFHSTCRPTAAMGRGEHLQQADRKGLGEKTARFGHRGAQYKIYSLDLLLTLTPASSLRRFPARHTPNPAVLCDLTTARDPASAPQPQYDIPQMTEEETVYESISRCNNFTRLPILTVV